MSSSSETLLDHIANFLKFISSAQSFWFLLNTSYDHGCHLASHFHLDPDECEVLLIVAGRQGVTASSKIRQRQQAAKREERERRINRVDVGGGEEGEAVAAAGDENYVVIV